MKTNKIISIAIADDHELIRKGLRMTLNTYKDCAVDIEASDGVDLLEKISSANKTPDICLLDISMPRMDGYETLKQVKKTWPQIRAIMLSMHYNEYSIIKSFQNGAGACLPKETSEDELHEVIVKVNDVGLHHSELTNHFINKLVLKESINTDLTEKEVEFLRLNCSELNYKQIAEIMKVSHRTVDSYRDNLFKKLSVTSRTALAVFAIQTGISPIIHNRK